MDFHAAFEAIDEDHSGEITVEELTVYMKKMNYKEAFVTKWLALFDADQSGTITYEEYCETLGLEPKEDYVAPVAASTSQSAAQPGDKKAKQGKKKEKQQDMTSKNTTSTGGATCPKNRMLAQSKVMMYSRAVMFRKRASYKMVKPGGKHHSHSIDQASTDDDLRVKKEIGGDKNGESRMVLKRRAPGYYPTESKPGVRRLRAKKCFSQHKRRLRASLTPGTVVILVAGRHRGKRVVFIRQLDSGLLLITGPRKLNGCPLRRIHQKYVIATSLKIDNVEAMKNTTELSDLTFKRDAAKKRKTDRNDDGELFQQAEKMYVVTAERKDVQARVDTELMSLIKKHEKATLVRNYLQTMFSLSKGDQPHRMLF